jgi:hypothetical protein
MRLAPDHPNKEFAKSTTNVCSLAQDLQESIDGFVSGDDDDDDFAQNDCDSDTSLNLDEILSPEKTEKKTKSRKNYRNNIQEFESLELVDVYLRTVSHIFKKSHSSKVQCSACNANHDKHLMEQIYFVCQCGIDCGLGWRAVSCCKEDSTWCLYQAGQLHELDPNIRKKLRAIGQKVPAPNGIALLVRNIYKDWLERDDMMSAKRLLIKLTEKRRKQAKRNKSERIEKYDFDQQLLPTLKQTQTFVSSYRMKNNTNTVKEIKRLIKNNLYRDGNLLSLFFICNQLTNLAN